MRRCLLILVFIGVIALSANPIDPTIIQQIWFNDAGEMMLQFGYHAAWLAGTELVFSDGTNTFFLTLEEDDWELYPITYNLAETMPTFSANPDGGFLSMYLNSYFIEEARWGNTSDCDVSPLNGTQSLYQYLFWVDNGFETYTEKHWAKSAHPDDVQNYQSASNSPIFIHTLNEDMQPIADVPIYYQNGVTPCGYSDQTGVYSFVAYSRNTHLQVYQPGTEELALDACFMAEPDSSYTFTVILQSTSVNDAQQSPVPGVLSLKPAVVRPGHSLNISFSKDLVKPARLELFDLKGRYLDGFDYYGEQNWVPPLLSSGMYFLRIKDGENILGSARFIILK